MYRLLNPILADKIISLIHGSEHKGEIYLYDAQRFTFEFGKLYEGANFLRNEKCRNTAIGTLFVGGIPRCGL